MNNLLFLMNTKNPVAYIPSFRSFTQSIATNLVFCYLLNESQKHDNRIVLSDKKLQDMLSISEWETRQAKSFFKKSGLVNIEINFVARGLISTIYEVNFDKLQALIVSTK